MHWRVKARVQNAVAMLPASVADDLYYSIQRRFGGIRSPEYLLKTRLEVVPSFLDEIERQSGDHRGRRFFELGTGRVPVIPLGLWLCGAAEVVTVDLHRYVRDDLVSSALTLIARNPTTFHELLAGHVLPERWALLQELAISGASTTEILDRCCIRYLSPVNAAATGLETGSIDHYVSYTVLEHISPDALEEIWLEAHRLLSPGGLFVNYIDYSDHFSHADPSISGVNFLQFEDDEWSKIARSSFMYMNRLRHDDFEVALIDSGHRLLRVSPEVDRTCEEILRQNDLRLASQYRDKSTETLSTVGAWITSTSKRSSGEVLL